MKRILCAVLALVMIAGFAGCKQETAETETILESSEEFTEETTEETEEETEEPTEEETVEETEDTSEPTETTEETVPPCANHSWGYWVQLEAPTTSAEGKRVRTCTVCGTEDVQVIEKLPKPSSHKHKYKTETSKATCKEDGWVYYYCSCGDWYQVEEKAKEHTWGDWTIKTRAEVKEDGTITDSVWRRKCKKCPEIETKTVKFCGDGKHDFGAKKTQKPTCGVDGYDYKECKTCGYIYKDPDSIVPMTGKHTWGKWIIVTPATCSKTGERKQVCTVCQRYKRTEKIPMLEHDYKEAVVKEPTCVENGEKQEVCSGCGDVKSTTDIPALGHDWGDWAVSAEDPTKEVRKCQRDGCNETETRDIQSSSTPEESDPDGSKEE